MKDTKKIKRIVIISLVVIIAIILIIAIITKTKDRIEHNEPEDSLDDIQEFVEEKGMNDVIFRKDYFGVTDLVSNFINSLNLKSDYYFGNDEDGNYVQIIELSDIKDIIYQQLGQEFIDKYNITNANVFDYLKTNGKKLNFTTIDMKYNKGDKVDKYLVYGVISSNEDNTFVSNAYYYVNIDNSNKTFSIEPIAETNIDMSTFKFNNEEKEIVKNDYNTFKFLEISDETTSREYLTMYKKLSIAEPETFYNYLNDGYRKARFGSLDNFKKYVAENKALISDISLSSYRVDVYDDYVQYICIDQKGNYYIFNETKVGNYTAYLDNYSYDIDQFIDKYDSSTDKNKVAMNAEKIRMAINNQDYEYVYSKLNDTYKQNNFPTIDSLKEFLNKKLFATNTFEYTALTNTSDTYTATINVSDYSKKDKSTKRLSINMRLAGERDFVFSFGLDD